MSRVAGFAAAIVVATAGVGPVVVVAADATLPEIPRVSTEDMEPQVVQALEYARAAVEREPGSAAAWGRYGIRLDAHDLYAPAVTCYAVARALAPDEFEWPYLMARAAEIVGGAPEQFLPLFEEALELAPSYGPGWIRYGEALLRAGREADAEAAFEKAVGLVPDLAAAYRGLGRARLTQGKAEEAREAQGRSRELDSEHTYPDPVLARVGDAGISVDQCLRRAAQRLEKGDPGRAVRDLEIAREVRPDDPVILALLGGAYAQLGRTGEAVAVYERALELREEYPEAHRDYAGLLVRVGRYDEAARHYARAEELGQSGADLVARRAAALAQAGDIEGALAEFRRASELGPLSAPDHNNWGAAWAQAGDAERAEEHFREATRLAPGSVAGWANLGAAREELGDREGALEAYRRAVEIDPASHAAERIEALER